MRLSSAQKTALRFAEYSGSGDAHYCSPDFVSMRTIKALEKKGLVDDDGTKFRWWLTETGEAERFSLVYDKCARCGAETHKEEAACIACGALKPWACNQA